MPLPSFEVIGDLFDILGDVAAGELNPATLNATVTFTSNVPTGSFVTWGGDLYRVSPVVAQVAVDGSLHRGGETVQLLANDPGLSVQDLQWQVEVRLPGPPNPRNLPHIYRGPVMASFWFDAADDGEIVDLSSVAQVPSTTVEPVVVSGVTEGTLLTMIADPGSDINDAIEAALAAVRADRKVFAVDDYGADPTGVSDSDAALAAAKTAMGSDPGQIVFGAGTYLLTEPCPSRFRQEQSLRGQGIAETRINFTGTGVLFSAFDDRAWGAGGPGAAGFFGDLWLDGTGCGADSVGLHIGDLSSGTVHIRIENFAASGCIGLLWRNDYTWAERWHVVAHLSGSATNVQYEASSHMYGTHWYNIGSSADQHGVVLINEAQLNRVSFTANLAMDSGATNSGIGVWIAAAGAGDGSYLHGHVQIVGETMGNLPNVGHRGIVFDDTSGLGINGYGLIELSSPGTAVWESSDCPMIFTGRIKGPGLGGMAFYQAERTIGLKTGNSGYMADTLYMSGANTILAQYASGAHTLTLDSGMSTLTDVGDPDQAAKWDLLFQQPSGGAAATFVWPAEFTWVDGYPPITSTDHDAVDHIRVTTTDFVTFYAKHLNARPAQNSQTGTSYTLALTDHNGEIDLTNANPITVVVPKTSDVPIPLGSKIDLIQFGSGQVTFVGGSGCTVSSRSGLKTAGQYARVTLNKIGNYDWVLSGDVTA